MIAVDSSSLVAYLRGESGSDVEQLDRALQLQHAALPPIVVTEMLSDPHLTPDAASLILSMPTMEVLSGFWIRSGQLRSCLRAGGFKARVADVLIAQNCLDLDVALLSRDRDFKKLVALANLKLLP